MAATKPLSSSEHHQLLTVAEYASFTRQGLTKAYADVREGHIESVRLGRTIPIPRLLGELVARIEEGDSDTTPGQGIRWLWRCPGAKRTPNEKLARRPKRTDEKRDERDTVKVLLELPDYAIVAPSNGGVHPSGKPYRRTCGDFTSIT